MIQDRWHRIEEIFHRVLAAADADRGRLLDEACAGDPDLHREISSLLEGAPEAGASIRDVLAAEAESLATCARETAVGHRLGPYRLRALLGEGGMGAVYLAERDDAQFSKQVAIKILPHALGSPDAIARFRDERQILAALEHRNIVRLLDGGSTDDGLPYLVMEHIEGLPITAFARKHALSIRARVRLVRDVCAAIQYAHQNLIIHRDIKPSNILVDESGTPKLVEFGIAKMLTPRSSFEREARTRTGHAPFTPEYASPEQARGEAVSTATDVYSVGAMLYELVTDRPPHGTTSDLLESIRVICNVEPVRPSLAAPPEWRRELAGDLDNIILKALHKEPERRYGTIEQLFDDLGRFLDGRPVNARVATLGYRARKFAGRHKATVLTTTLVIIALVTSTVISLRQAARADAQARRAEVAAAIALAEKKRAEAETARAQTETDRARKAERQIQAQLEQLTAEKARREEAEHRASRQSEIVVVSKSETRRESRKAREAEQRAETATARARTEADRAGKAERRVEVLFEQLTAEAARRKEAEKQRKAEVSRREEAEKQRKAEMARREEVERLLAIILTKVRRAEQESMETRQTAQAECTDEPLYIRQVMLHQAGKSCH